MLSVRRPAIRPHYQFLAVSICHCCSMGFLGNCINILHRTWACHIHMREAPGQPHARQARQPSSRPFQDAVGKTLKGRARLLCVRTLRQSAAVRPGRRGRLRGHPSVCVRVGAGR